MKVLLRIAYNGTNYSGFQKQPHSIKPTIQNVLENVINKFYKREKNNSILTTASGRTDTGVHADDQPITFEITNKEASFMQASKIAYVLNKQLPSSIRILKSSFVSNTFHPRFNAAVRLYVYSIALPSEYSIEKKPNEKIYFSYKPICSKKLHLTLKAFEGKHNFTTFCSASDNSTNKTRHIYKIFIKENYNLMHIYIYGNAFLRSMVRSIIGNAIKISYKKNSAYEIKKLIALQNPNFAKIRVPAEGLCLKKVFYSQIFL